MDPDKSSPRNKTTWRTSVVVLAIAVSPMSVPAPTAPEPTNTVVTVAAPAGPHGGGGNTGNEVDIIS
ncbi:hypothetical protein AB0M80_23140 [Amycolatopsis sp. NPDC051045]|uniref:hypothetical protein n=1 Tax=Amycolatopsis sp. NPDC051045 TaxID=3156922 RepID=UPI003438B4FF